jgi:biopolymer transport protein ExbD
MSKLILLVAFLAQASAERPRRLLADLPADGLPAIAGKAVPWPDLARALKSHAESGIRQLVLRVDGSAPFSSVQQVMAAAREAGMEGVQFSTDKTAAAPRFSDESRRSVRIKVREGAKGLELLVLEERTAVSLEDLRKKLKALERGPVVVDAEFEVPYGAVREIVAACTEEGFDKVSFAGAARKAGAVRVLYAEQVPRWEYRYLRNMLERSAEFQVDVYLATADPDFSGSLRAFPAQLSSYDVVLMGDLRSLEADRRKTLTDFVLGGGAVVWTGPETSGTGWLGNVLESICPVKLAGEGVLTTYVTGKIVRAEPRPMIDEFWRQRALAFHVGGKVDRIDPDARTLVELVGQGGTGSSALLVTQEVSKGRAAYVGAANTWTLREGVGDQPHFAPFWTKVLKWAAGR